MHRQVCLPRYGLGATLVSAGKALALLVDVFAVLGQVTCTGKGLVAMWTLSSSVCVRVRRGGRGVKGR